MTPNSARANSLVAGHRSTSATKALGSRAYTEIVIRLAGLDLDELRTRLARMRNRAPLHVACGLVVILSLFAWHQSSTGRLTAVHNASAFGMRISTQGDSFRLTWDSNNSAVKQASDGVLHILDGGGRRDIALNTEQVHTGSFLYRPQSDDITFDLELHRSGTMLGFESIRLLDGSHHLLTEGGIDAARSEAAPAPTPRGTTSRRARAAFVVGTKRVQRNVLAGNQQDPRPAPPVGRTISSPTAPVAAVDLAPPPGVPNIPRSGLITKQAAAANPPSRSAALRIGNGIWNRSVRNIPTYAQPIRLSFIRIFRGLHHAKPPLNTETP
jgi:hypothetical protein